jgi:hypothetical protein
MNKLKGKKQTPEHIAKRMANSSTWKKRSYTEEYKEKLRQKMLGNKKGFKKGMTPWNKDKIGEYNLGEPSLEHRQKLSLSKMGENNPSWKGGISILKTYPLDWTETLKESIRERDKYECKICGIHQDEIDISLHVHHIDYDKDNLNPENLISLCPSCHSKTNHDREEWIEYFNKQSTVA